MRLIKRGSRGNSVKSIQHFLIGKKYDIGIVDGVFGPKMESGVKRFQKHNKLVDDGIIGNQTLGLMLVQGLALLPETPDYPAKPNFSPLVGNAARAKVFGHFDYKSSPTNDNKEGITILGSWESDNIVSVDLPQLAKATGGKYTRMRFHKLAAKQLKDLWEAWEDADLLHLVKTYEGAFYPRYVRGSRTTLSNHSFGSAFDINYKWNGLGKVPAYVGEEGSVRELVPIANKFGFYWGGHFSRKDGMHMEIAKIL